MSRENKNNRGKSPIWRGNTDLALLDIRKKLGRVVNKRQTDASFHGCAWFCSDSS